MWWEHNHHLDLNSFQLTLNLMDRPRTCVGRVSLLVALAQRRKEPPIKMSNESIENIKSYPHVFVYLAFLTPWLHLPLLLIEFKMWRIFGEHNRKPMLGGKIAWQCFKLNEDRSLQGRYNELGVCHWTRAFNGLTMNFLAYHNVYSKENHAIFKTSQPVARSKQGNSSSQG